MTSTERSSAATARTGVVAAAEFDRQPIGRYLRHQRELRDMSIDDLAALTRIPVRSLVRLESGAFDDDVDGFVRGFVRTVAKGLGLDPDDTLSRMLVEPRPTDDSDLRRIPGLPGGLVALALLLLLGLGAAAVSTLGPSWWRSAVTEARDEIVYRRDPVRALAETSAAQEHEAPAPDVSAAPSAAPH